MSVASFWLQMLLYGLDLSTAVFAIYWMAVAGAKIWLKAIGGGILACNFFLMLLSLAAFAFLLLSRLNIKLFFDRFAHHLFAVTTFIALVLCCVLMSFATEVQAESYLNEIQDFCNRNLNDSAVVSFVQSHSNDYSKHSFVADRTTEPYSSIAALFGIWLPATLIYLFVSGKAAKEKLNPKPQTQPQQNPNDLPPLQMQEGEGEDNPDPEAEPPSQRQNNPPGSARSRPAPNLGGGGESGSHH